MRTLTAVPTLVESPFIIVKIGDYTFGQVQKIKSTNKLDVTFPEYMKSVEITKVNGEVNTYKISMEYPITKGSDPNLIDYVFSSVSATRRLTISYGDWNSPAFIYKEEECLITNVSSNLDFSSPKIVYNIDCVSDAKGLQGINHNFPSWEIQPSSLLYILLQSSVYRLTDIFTGMTDINKVKSYGLIQGGDKVVHIPAKLNCNIWDYINYVVGFMIPDNEDEQAITGKGFYRLSVIDDNRNELGGSYFTVTKISVTNNIALDNELTNSVLDLGAYQLDIGYPSNNFVTNFSLQNDQEWSILYNASNKVDLKNYSYKITNTGELKRNYSPSLTRISNWDGTTAADKAWWTAVTEFPLKAVLTLKGLVRPTILMSYIKINVVFYGQKHISSGYYVIEKETDIVSESGYRTVLNLLRVKGDTIGEDEVTVRNNVTDPSTGFNLATNSGTNTNYRPDNTRDFQYINQGYYSTTDEFTSINAGYGNGKVLSKIKPKGFPFANTKVEKNNSDKFGLHVDDMNNNQSNTEVGIF